MRRIKSQEEIQKRDKRNKVIIGLILAFAMLSSTLGYAFLNAGYGESIQEKEEYNEIEFTRNENGFWEFELEGQAFQTTYLPSDVLELESAGVSLQDIHGKPLYFIYDNEYVLSEIVNNVGRYASRVQHEDVCLEGDCDEDDVVKTCKDNVVIIRDMEETKIYKEDNCLFIEGSYYEQIRAADKIIFEILGIE